VSHITSSLAGVFALLCVSPALPAGQIYWTDKGDRMPGIYRGDMDGAGEYEVLLDEDNGMIEPRGLGLDLDGGRIYWTDAGSGKIQRADLDGKAVEDLVVTGNVFLADIELDLRAGKMYWSDTGLGAIRSADLNGDNVADVRTSLNAPYYLELTESHIYWAELDNSVIHRMNRDGSGAVVDVVTGQDRVRDMRVDPAGNMIYWNDRDLHVVRRAPLDGGSTQTLYAFPSPQEGKPHGMNLDLDAGMIYWTDTRRDLKWVARGSIDGSTAYEVLYDGLDDPWDIELVVPEPSTLVLAIAGLIGMFAFGCWRRKR